MDLFSNIQQVNLKLSSIEKDSENLNSNLTILFSLKKEIEKCKNQLSLLQAKVEFKIPKLENNLSSETPFSHNFDNPDNMPLLPTLIPVISKEKPETNFTLPFTSRAPSLSSNNPNDKSFNSGNTSFRNSNRVKIVIP